MSNSSDWGEMSEKRPADLGEGEREPEREHTHSESLEERQRANFSFCFCLMYGLWSNKDSFARHP